ncbi:ribosome small subunit-dependent GTPase A [Brochothrix thermosphacta]|uniref:ribosome small subunit-dependent GTPase A n=1 Tax=Brochothrix thermosphacta TaxID=2756 RepID=UPI0039AF2946
MHKGRIVKSLSGFYYVETAEKEMYQTRARGNFRASGITPLVGDWVEFQADNKKEGYIRAMGKRDNSFVRPPIANVDQVWLFFSATEPDLSTTLIDRFLVAIEKENVTPLMFITKMDLLSDEEQTEIRKTTDVYVKMGYKVIILNEYKQESIKEHAAEWLGDNVCVIAGQSGVGKSTFLNSLHPEWKLETGIISAALNRGKHTTRHVELLPFGSGYIADTPGFSQIDITDLTPEGLGYCFPDFMQQGSCKYRGCVHQNEPHCKVKEAVETGDIAAFRYKHYSSFLIEIQQKKRRY